MITKTIIFFKPFRDDLDVNGGSSTNYCIPPNTQIPPNAQFPLNAQFSPNARFPPNGQFLPNFSTPQYPPNFSNFVGYPYNSCASNFQNFQYSRGYMSQTEFWQLGMQAPPHEFSPMSSNSSQRASIDASVFDKEPTTPSFVPETQPSINIDDVDVENFVDLEVKPKNGKKNRTAWLDSENEKLARVYVTIGQDSEVGRAQIKDKFWKRVTYYYNCHRPDGMVERDYNQIKSHWHNTVSKTITRFNSIYNKLFDAYRSGWSDENLLSNVYSQYKDEMKKAFTLERFGG